MSPIDKLEFKNKVAFSWEWRKRNVFSCEIHISFIEKNFSDLTPFLSECIKENCDKVVWNHRRKRYALKA